MLETVSSISEIVTAVSTGGLLLLGLFKMRFSLAPRISSYHYDSFSTERSFPVVLSISPGFFPCRLKTIQAKGYQIADAYEFVSYLPPVPVKFDTLKWVDSLPLEFSFPARGELQSFDRVSVSDEFSLRPEFEPEEKPEQLFLCLWFRPLDDCKRPMRIRISLSWFSSILSMRSALFSIIVP